MRLSPWHMELAKRVAQGHPPREIMKEIKVSGSRLSVLKANPLFQKQVEKYRRLEDDKYRKAVEVFGEKTKTIAEELVRLVESPLTPHKVKLDAGLAILDRVAESTGGKSGRMAEMTFEQTLKVTKRALGWDSEEGEPLDGTDWDSAQAALDEDVVDVQEEVN